MADAITGNTQLGATKNDYITEIVQKELKFKAKLAPWFRDVSSFAIKGRKTIEFPKLESFTIANRTEGSAGDATTLVATTDSMALDFNAYVAWIIDSKSEIQSNIESQVEYAKRAASAHARYFDNQVIAELEAGAGFGAGLTTITYAGLLDMREYLLDNDADMDQAVWICSVDQEKVLMGLDEFKRADVYGTSAIPTGVIGFIFGVPVMVHNGVSAQVYLAEKDGLGYGFQMAPSMSEQGANEYGTNAVRKAVDQLFGVQALQIDQGSTAPSAGRSGLIARMTTIV